MNRTKAFVSYSRKDELWKDRLMTHLAILEFEGLLHLWADTQISAGDDWYQRIQTAMDDSRVAVLLVSPDFLASKFIRNEEVPRLLQRHACNGMLILPLIARPCAWGLVPWLSRIEVRPKHGKPLSMGSDNDIDAELASFTSEVASLLNRSAPGPPVTTVSAYKEFERACNALRQTGQVVDDHVVTSILTEAIKHGAPVYNGGSPIDCARIYRYAANRLIELIRTNQSSARHTRVPPGVREAENLLPAITPAEGAITAENADELAWALRRAFDRILDVSRRTLTADSDGPRASGCR